MTEKPDPTRLYLRCETCAELFSPDSIKMPMDIRELTKAMKKVRCPECGKGPKGLVMASKVEAIAISHRPAG